MPNKKPKAVKELDQCIENFLIFIKQRLYFDIKNNCESNLYEAFKDWMEEKNNIVSNSGE